MNNAVGIENSAASLPALNIKNMTVYCHSMRILKFIMLLFLAGADCLTAAAQSPDVCAQAASIPTAECRALDALYKSLNGNQWRNSAGWWQTDNPCQWYGVGCRAGHVFELSLRENQLSGTIPREIGDLAYLESFDFGDNAISGELPEEIGLLKQLRGLNLRNNQLSGALPDNLGNLRLLEWLYVSQNNFDGALPVSLAALSHLDTLYFRETNLCEPLQPDFQMWLTGITSLGRSDIPCRCGLMTDIPIAECQALFAVYDQTHGQDWIDNAGWLQSLSPCTWERVQCANGHVTTLLLDGNNLRGHLPPELGHLTKLTVLDVSQNHLTGTIPAALGGLTALTRLNASRNALEGPLPQKIGQLQHLTALDLSDNRLEDRLPATLGNLRALHSLNLARNRFSGPLPATLGQLEALIALNVSQNPLYGLLPHALANLGNLQVLDVSQTYLRGRLPATLSRLPQLRVLRFEQSQVCVPEQADVQQWMQGIEVSGVSGGTCPAPYTGLLPIMLLVVAGCVILLPGGYQACVSVFGESFVPPERLRGYYRKHGAPREGLPIQMLITGLFALSCELLWGVYSLFVLDSLGYGFGVGLMLYLGYIIVGRRVRRRTRITWIGRILGLLICAFLACFLLLTLDIPYAPAQLFSILVYILLIMIPVWLMTSGVSTGGYWELMAEGLFLGSLWGLLAGGILGDALCAYAPLMYGDMSDILNYRVFSQTVPEITRRFLANELTGIFLFSLLGTGAGALTRSLQIPLTRLSLPIHAWMTRILRPLLQALQKTA